MISPEVTQLLNLIEVEFRKRGLTTFVIGVHDNTPNAGKGGDVVFRTSNPDSLRAFVAQKFDLNDSTNVVQWGGGR